MSNDGLQPTDPLYWRETAEEIAAHFAKHNEAGSPPKLAQPGLVARLLAYVAKGNHPATACNLVGISPSNSGNWVRAAANGDERYLPFLQAVRNAEALSEAFLFGSVIDAGNDPKLWTARAWALERRFPDRFAKRDTVDYLVSGNVQHQHMVGNGNGNGAVIRTDDEHMKTLATMLDALRLPNPADAAPDAAPDHNPAGTIDGTYTELDSTAE